MTHRHGLTAITDALIRVQTLSSKHSEQAKMIDLGATAWAMGVTPEMMEVFGRIASSMRVTGSDIAQLEIHGIANRLNRKPWLDAKPGEVWALEVDGEEILCRSVTGGHFHPVFEHHHWAMIANDSNKITDARRIWPETGGHDD